MSNQSIKKRTSLMPTWMAKKKQDKNPSNNKSQLNNNIPDVKQSESNSSHKSPPHIEIIKESQPYEKVTYKNTTTRSVERVDTDGSYTNATEVKENVEEIVRYSNSKKTSRNDEFIDLKPKKNNNVVKPNKFIKSDNYSNYRNNLRMVSQDGLLIKDLDLDEQTMEVCLAAVRQNGLSLKYIMNQSPNICLEAIKQNYLSFTFVVDKSEYLCNEAVKINGLCLQFIKNQTTTICTNAIKQNPFALEYVITQTDKICEAAVFRDGLTLEFVQDKTVRLCLLALQQNSFSIKHIPLSLLSGSIDFSDYVFICVGNRTLIPSNPKLKSLKQIYLPYNDTNYCLLNALMYNSIPVNYVLEKHGYIDDKFINNLVANNHFILVV